MDAQDFRRLYFHEPFQPFQVELKDGRTFTVMKPGHISISHSGTRMVFTDVIENFEIIDFVDVKEYRLLEAMARAG